MHKHYAIHHGELHTFDDYKTYQKGSEWCVYTTENGSKYGIEISLIADTVRDAYLRYINKMARMIKRNQDESKAALDSADNWTEHLVGAIRDYLCLD